MRIGMRDRNRENRMKRQVKKGVSKIKKGIMKCKRDNLKYKLPTWLLLKSIKIFHLLNRKSRIPSHS